MEAAIGVETLNAFLAIAFLAVLFMFSSSIRRHRRRKMADGCNCYPELEDKPQNRFKRVLADNSYSPFKHFKREGKEKEISLRIHPFAREIDYLLKHPPDLKTFITSHRNPNSSCHFVWIDTEDQLEALANILNEEEIFAVDTEQHSIRSFLGFTSLIQISTWKEDYLIDTIALHDMMATLRPAFANPAIIKVFHGADNDVLWLQRDFHIYVVNMFDTAKACEILSKPQKSLAYLLETYCGVYTDKTLQREDWRLRPLSDEMTEYARNDAHYLLYIAGCLASELESKTSDISASPSDELNFFLETSRRSNTVCLQLYAKEVESTPGASAASSILSRNMNIVGLTSSKNLETKDLIWILCAWRDLIARIHDESLRYVLSDQAIAALAVIAPKNPSEIYNVILQADTSNVSSNAYPTLPSPSPIIKNHMDDLCFLLLEVDANVDDVIQTYWQKHLNGAQCCPLSPYNYALLSQFNLKHSGMSFSKSSVEKFNSTVSKKASRELFIQKFSCKSPVYHNCRIYATDGRMLCYCDRKKLEWYMRRGLAKMVEEDPPAIMLLFETKGRPEDEGNEFYIQSKKNMCVGCGEKSHYIRYRIIPSCYRMHFPEHLKSHRSHDIVLLCVDCHEIAHSAAEKYKKQVAQEFGIPLFVQKIVNSGESTAATVASTLMSADEETGVSPLQLRTAAMALLRHGSNMPSGRLEELMQIVRTYFGRQEVSVEDLEAALLVGMSPHERRRFEKKRGLSFRHTEQNVVYKNHVSSSSQINNHNKEKDKESINDQRIHSNLSPVDTNGNLLLETFGSSSIQILNREVEIEQGNASYLKMDIENEDQLDDSSVNLLLMPDEITSSETAKKMSLLGHGPHGKQVVEHLLRRYREEGVRQFCQRWRKVFVDAIHPRFLPLGWDIMHSGRRDFGDYSVYNPAKKALPETNMVD
ncbi:protein RRP6-like 3 isoform X1 [Zingiber officinale]|uniref:protein RRP6-like 3 isoform X1 n=2 Tax=Zingiber officinale TaxID=94328 RepID=UPI001C4D5673|nr:protein RRP6-like 3 isoform X1 [Zingiber officinale]